MSDIATPVPLLEAPATARARPWRLAIETCLDRRGPAFACEPVLDEDLVDQHGELWWSCAARSGRPDVPLEELTVATVPLFLDGGEGLRCRGFALVGRRPDGFVGQCEFGRASLDPVATRAARRLREEGRIAADQLTYYHLRAEPGGPEEAPAASPTGLRAVLRREPFRCERRPLAPLLACAQTVGSDPEHLHYPVFYTDAALARAERIARKGAARTPAVETGALLVGPLCACPETGEMFAVVVSVLATVGAEEEAYSLGFTGRTWERVEAVMRAKRANPATRAHRILGQAHGHNFGPSTETKPCEECAEQATCPRHTAHLSLQDLEWSRATFSAQPWQLGHVFGLDARGGPVSTFYGQRGAQLCERGFHVVPAGEAERFLSEPSLDHQE